MLIHCLLVLVALDCVCSLRGSVVLGSPKDVEHLKNHPLKVKWKERDGSVCEDCAFQKSLMVWKGQGKEILYYIFSDGYQMTSLMAREVGSGKLLYSVPLGFLCEYEEIEGLMLTDGSILIVYFGGVKKIDPEGNIQWELKINHPLISPLINSQNLLVVTTLSCGGLFGIDIETGEIQWYKDFDKEMVHCSQIYVLNENKGWLIASELSSFSHWYSIDLNTGRYIKKGSFQDTRDNLTQLNYSRGNSISNKTRSLYMLHNIGDVSCFPYCSFEPSLFEVDAVNGELLLVDINLPRNFSSSINEIGMTIHNNLILLSSLNGNVMAYKKERRDVGKVLWQTTCLESTTPSRVTFNNQLFSSFLNPLLYVHSHKENEGVVLVGHSSQLCALDLSSGSLLWEVNLSPEALFGSAVLLPNGRLFMNLINRGGATLVALK
eukprot:TRINITY_DN20146_c0_g1_i1.p1 TRINITY_DN20146_c0_g1~~TRINITY_DN20146_c0_g1_i1.p1  ORF type:complete len:434 (+),score=116.47 TRINITY_DN20146_c0_g1_i1:97-1398(+)